MSSAVRRMMTNRQQYRNRTETLLNPEEGVRLGPQSKSRAQGKAEIRLSI
jgi:hypothetical protein